MNPHHPPPFLWHCKKSLNCIFESGCIDFVADEEIREQKLLIQKKLSVVKEKVKNVDNLIFCVFNLAWYCRIQFNLDGKAEKVAREETIVRFEKTGTFLCKNYIASED